MARTVTLRLGKDAYEELREAAVINDNYFCRLPQR